MTDNVLQKIINKKSEKILSLKKTITLESLNNLGFMFAPNYHSVRRFVGSS